MPPSTELVNVNHEDKEDRLPPGLRLILPVWLLKLSDEISEKYWDIPHPELFRITQEILEFELGKGDATRRIRMAFWDEYDKSIKTNSPMQFYNVIGALCSVSRFRKLCRVSPPLVCWLLNPPNSYSTRLQELSMLGEDRMKEIMSVSPIYNGKVDAKLAMAQVKLWEILQDRIHGAVTQTVENKNLNLNANVAAPGSPGAAAEHGASLQEIESKIEEVKKKINTLTSPAPIRVDVVADGQLKPELVDPFPRR